MTDTAVRALPHSIDAERSVLGAILIKPSALDEVTDLHTDDFFMPAHREIFEAMRAVSKRGGAIDTVSLADELRSRGALGRLEGGETYLLTCANAVPTAENVAHYARTVATKAALRRLIAVCAEIQSSAYGDFGDPREFLAEARRKVSAVDMAGSDDQPEKIGVGLGDVMESIEKRAADPSAYLLTTGFYKFDTKLGGIAASNLVVVAARPGMGKSAWVLQVLIDNALRGIPGLLFSMEMSKAELKERAFAQLGEVNSRTIHTGKLSGPEWMRVHSAASKIENMSLFLYTKQVKAERICSIARRWFVKLPTPANGRKKMATVAIDYVGLIPSSGDEEDRRHEIGAMSRAFKGLASELDIPVFEIAQLNRESEKDKRKPRLSDLKDAGELEQDANMVIFPWRDGNPPASGMWPASLIIGKNRGTSPPAEIDIEWQGEFVRFVDGPPSVEQGRLPYDDA